MSGYSIKLREEELKNKVARDYFSNYDCTQIIGNIDFCVSANNESFLWAEAKSGRKKDIYESLTQLVLTIGKARTFEKFSPPLFIGAFDAEKIAFLPYHKIMAIFSQTDFNWNVAPSDHGTNEFKQIYDLAERVLLEEVLLFHFGLDDAGLKEFIHKNFKAGVDLRRKEITRNNFVFVYNEWRAKVMPTIAIDWEEAKKFGLIDADFYLADLLSCDNATLKDKLYVLLKSDHYELDRVLSGPMGMQIRLAHFRDGQIAHKQFWNIYARPPKEEYWDYIVGRRDMLVPQDIRERKGSFYTPQKWVELSQKYLADVLGQDWQDEYVIWDCAAGTGNLLAGLSNPYKIYASTLDKADVDVMLDRIKNGANLLEKHVFQFDFLNDPLDSEKIPEGLRKILQDEEKRKKLLIYINPPYAEATSSKTISNSKDMHKEGVSQKDTGISYKKLLADLGRGINEVFVQFLMRVYKEMPGCTIGQFSTLKTIQSFNFQPFRNVFQAELKTLFIVPANTFDNVKGSFPIGFFIWDTNQKKQFSGIMAHVYDHDGKRLDDKQIYPAPKKLIMQWLQQFYDNSGERLAYLVRGASDMQNNRIVFITQQPSQAVISHSQTNNVTVNNLWENCVFNAVRHVIEHTWQNDRDQYLFPNDSYKTDNEFKTDCLAYSLFDNNIKSSPQTVNYWIPFTEMEVKAQDEFQSHFMTDYIAGKFGSKVEWGGLVVVKSSAPDKPLQFSEQAKAVFDAGRELWRYYHAQPGINVNASLYDIKEFFQGRDESGRMKNNSADEQYNNLIANLRLALKQLAKKIEPKVYEHGFLKK